jgi:hypothetical protein
MYFIKKLNNIFFKYVFSSMILFAMRFLGYGLNATDSTFFNFLRVDFKIWL